MNRLTLSVHKRVSLVECLRRGKPLKGRTRRTGFEENQDLGLVRKGNCERLSKNWGIRREGERERGKGKWVKHRGDRERASVESEGSRVRGREGEKCGRGNGGRWEIEEESEGDMGSEWVC